jgi:hypothetical protein
MNKVAKVKVSFWIMQICLYDFPGQPRGISAEKPGITISLEPTIQSGWLKPNN